MRYLCKNRVLLNLMRKLLRIGKIVFGMLPCQYFFADPRRLNRYNAPSDEDRRVIIHVLILYC